MAQPADFSMATADKIDNEVKALVERAYRCGCVIASQFTGVQLQFTGLEMKAEALCFVPSYAACTEEIL